MSDENPAGAPPSAIDIDYVAQLARIELTAEEKVSYGRQLERILEYFERLRAVDVEGIEPMAHPFPLENVMAEDEENLGFTTEQALANAPEVRENQVVVPRVLGED